MQSGLNIHRKKKTTKNIIIVTKFMIAEFLDLFVESKSTYVNLYNIR